MLERQHGIKDPVEQRLESIANTREGGTNYARSTVCNQVDAFHAHGVARDQDEVVAVT